MESSIDIKVVVITGASSGIGEATARRLAKNGARVVLAARRVERLTSLAQEIRTAGGTAEAFAADVTSRADVEALTRFAIERFGRLDVLINNAGLMSIAPLSDVKVDEWDRMIDINIKGVLYGIAAALPVFQKQGSGHFINVASIAGHKVFAPGGTVYSGTKFAVRAISEGLRQEVGGSIRTTTISPGAIETELKLGTSHEASSEGLEQFYKVAIPSDTIARAIEYAISQPADVDINDIIVRPTVQEF
ncbi:NADP-dependent 3-hydroxy acid dehydrogenase YdfG [Paraburkholderia sp. CI2]|uniref:SDR family oxidoreductase n=1 Tax=Paraburkholderia sp. CI2 TaxID=2723093 RepID=UPI0016227EDD|nr:SDR family oxidoreductase [Paraburkholderia sp. CI2]MBB5466801.1 NADP-dependent 3-hydroxy acid dehydrogenase YdfG [Paraburkholderia sp. CI2]